MRGGQEEERVRVGYGVEGEEYDRGRIVQGRNLKRKGGN